MYLEIGILYVIFTLLLVLGLLTFAFHLGG